MKRIWLAKNSIVVRNQAKMAVCQSSRRKDRKTKAATLTARAAVRKTSKTKSRIKDLRTSTLKRMKKTTKRELGLESPRAGKKTNRF